MSLKISQVSQKSRNLALEPRRRSLSSAKLTMKAFWSSSGSFFRFENKLPTLADQNWQKNRQKGLTNKSSLYIFLQNSDDT